MTDCFQPVEAVHRITYNVLKAFNHYKKPYLIVTKSDLIARDDYIEVLEPINGDDGDKIVSFFFTIILGLLMSLITLDKVFEDIKEANSSYYNSQIEYLSGIDNISLLNGQIEDANQHILTLKREGGRKS